MGSAAAAAAVRGVAAGIEVEREKQSGGAEEEV